MEASPVKTLHRNLMLATALAAGLAAAPLAVSQAHAADGTSISSDPGFDPATGQINPGFDKKNPTMEQPRKIPTQAEIVAARAMPFSTQPSAGAEQQAPLPAADNMRPETKDGQATAGGPQATNASSDAMKNGSQPSSGSKPATMGAASSDAGTSPAQSAQGSEPHGPIGAFDQTMPAKFSARNEVLDRVPLMNIALPLSKEQRQQIYQALMQGDAQSSAEAEALGPTSVLSSNLFLNDMHEMPTSLSGIATLKGLTFVKAKNKILLVRPENRTVIDEITS
jgi:hypothetical protein